MRSKVLVSVEARAWCICMLSGDYQFIKLRYCGSESGLRAEFHFQRDVSLLKLALTLQAFRPTK